MKKLLFILSVFFVVVACDESTESTRPIMITPSGFEIEAGEGGVYTFTAGAPAYLYHCSVERDHCSVERVEGEKVFEEQWNKPMKLPKTFEKTWFTLTQRDDRTFEITIDENHDSGLVLTFTLFPYVLGADIPSSVRFELR